MKVNTIIWTLLFRNNFLNGQFFSFVWFSDGTRAKIACEGNVVSIEANENETIQILGSEFGRMDSVTCGQGPVQNTSCRSSKCHEIVMNLWVSSILITS